MEAGAPRPAGPRVPRSPPRAKSRPPRRRSGSRRRSRWSDAPASELHLQVVALDAHRVDLEGHGGRRRQHGAVAHVELGEVAGADDLVLLEFAVGEGAILVRAGVVEGVEGAADVRHRHREIVDLDLEHLPGLDAVGFRHRHETSHVCCPFLVAQREPSLAAFSAGGQGAGQRLARRGRLAAGAPVRPCCSCQRATSSQVANQTERWRRMKPTSSSSRATREARPLMNGWQVKTKQPFSLCIAVNSRLHIWSTRPGSAIALLAPYTCRKSGASSMIHCTGTSVSGPSGVGTSYGTSLPISELSYRKPLRLSRAGVHTL